MGSLVQNLKTRIQDFQSVGEVQEIGRIISVGDGIAQIQGLDRAVYGELVEFETGVQGMVMDLSRNSVGCVLLGQETGLREGSIVTRTAAPPMCRWARPCWAGSWTPWDSPWTEWGPSAPQRPGPLSMRPAA